MDRFIVTGLSLPPYIQVYNLKSNMDRFIEELEQNQEQQKDI